MIICTNLVLQKRLKQYIICLLKQSDFVYNTKPNTKERNKCMKIKKEINLFAGMFTAEEIYRYGDIILLLGHIIYLVLFYRFGVYQMVYYNYFSVAFYAVMYFLLHFKKIGKISFTYLVLGEIIVHACMGAYYICWSA